MEKLTRTPINYSFAEALDWFSVRDRQHVGIRLASDAGRVGYRDTFRAARLIVVQPKSALARDSCVDDAAIWRKHKEELIRFATILVGVDRAEDVLSTVVERILRRSGSLVALDDARPYLFRAVLNESRGVLRRSNVTPWERDFVEDSIGFRPDVAAAVGSLPERQRAAVYLTYWRDLPVSEVADLMGCRPGTVKRYLHLSRNRLKEVLEP